MSLKAVGSMVVIRPDIAKENKTELGIIVSSSESKIPERGEVLSVGSKVVDVKKGDRVYFRKNSAEEIGVGGETLFALKAEDIIATLE